VRRARPPEGIAPWIRHAGAWSFHQLTLGSRKNGALWSFQMEPEPIRISPTMSGFRSF
jgi:hypothetical protein